MPTREEKIQAIQRAQKIEKIRSFQNSQTSSKPPPGDFEVGVRGALEGGLSGWAGEGEGALDTAVDFVKGDIPREWGSVKERYGQNTEKAQEAHRKAKEANPDLYGAAELGGGLAVSAALPATRIGKGLATVGSKLAPLARTAIAGGLQGAASGAGYSEAKDASGVLQDAGLSAGLGVGTGALAHSLPAVAKKGKEFADHTRLTDVYNYLAQKAGKVAEKGKSLLSGMTEEGLARYRARPDAINSARSTAELGEALGESIEGLKQRGIEGSQAAAELIPENGKISLGPLQDKLDELQSRYEGAGGIDNELPKASLEKFRSQVNDLVKNQQISSRDAKRIIKNIDARTKLAERQGMFDAPEQLDRVAVRKELDRLLKDQVPEYAEAMKPVAADFAALSPASKMYGNPMTNASKLETAARNTKGKQKAQRKVLQDLAKRTGVDILQEAEDRGVKDAFEGAAGGAFTGRRTMAGSAVGALTEAARQAESDEDFDPLRLAMSMGTGGSIGAASDRYAPQMTKMLMDSSREGAIKWSKDQVKRILDLAARKGPDALRAAQFILLKQYGPQYQEMLESKD